MKKVYFTMLFFTLSIITTSSHGQDTVFFNTGDEMVVEVIKVNPTDVEYKKYDNLDGPIYTTLITDLFMIRYQNGGKDVFSKVITNVTPVNPDIALNREIHYDGASINRWVNRKYLGAGISALGLVVTTTQPNSLTGYYLSLFGTLSYLISDIVVDVETSRLGSVVGRLTKNRKNKNTTQFEPSESSEKGTSYEINTIENSVESIDTALKGPKLGPLDLMLNQELIFTDNRGLDYNAHLIFYNQSTNYYFIEYTNSKGHTKNKAIYPSSFDQIRSASAPF